MAVNELPRGAATLWLRLLGRGQAQADAVQDLLELLAKSRQDPLEDATVQLLVA